MGPKSKRSRRSRTWFVPSKRSSIDRACNADFRRLLGTRKFPLTSDPDETPDTSDSPRELRDRHTGSDPEILGERSQHFE